MTGEMRRAISIFSIPFSCSVLNPAPTPTAPMRPPTSACEELLGMPKNQVRMFHRMALNSAAKMTSMVIVPGTTMSCPMVLATATPKRKGATNSAMAVIPSAARGDKARDEIIVATMLLESCKPFRKLKIEGNYYQRDDDGQLYLPALMSF